MAGRLTPFRKTLLPLDENSGFENLVERWSSKQQPGIGSFEQQSTIISVVKEVPTRIP
jgi:hypothetical protein